MADGFPMNRDYALDFGCVGKGIFGLIVDYPFGKLRTG